MHFWHWGRRAERLRPTCQDWGNYGSAMPGVAYVIYLIKLLAFIGIGLLILRSTPGIGTLADIRDWWTEPVVFQKMVAWGLLFEVLGLGCGFGPLTMHFLPPFGGCLNWARPGTIRLPPWPDRVPGTGGTRRTVLDVLLYLALVLSAGWLLLAPAEYQGTDLAGPVRMLDPVLAVPLAVLVPLIGLRDKTIFLAARAEHYWVLVLTFFLPFTDLVVTAKILLVLMWWAAATSKLSRLFPYSLAVSLSHTPLTFKWIRKWLFRALPDDMRPSILVTVLSVLVVIVEYLAPLTLLVADNGTLILLAMTTLVLFHAAVILSVPIAAPLEWNAWIIVALLFLFHGRPSLTLATAAHPLLPALFAVPVVCVVTWGNLRPDQVSFLVSMRYYAGNWATSMWALNPTALPKIEQHVVKSSAFAKHQLTKLYGEQIAELFTHKVQTFRALQLHGRALFGLLPRAAGAQHESAFVMEGELVAGAVLGWDFGEGHLHGAQLLAALQERCHFEPGEVRIVVLESVPLGSQAQSYQLVDAATGVFECGRVLLEDMARRQPWEIDNVPVMITSRT